MDTYVINQKVNSLLNNATESAAVFSQLNQKQTDKIVKAVYKAAFKNRVKLAKMAGSSIPENVRILMAPLDSVGNEHPLSSEISCPILAYYVKKDFSSALKTCIDLNYHGGMGHTASIYTNNEDHVKAFAVAMNAARV